MAVQLSVAARNARLDSFETAAGTTPNLYIRTGAQPADCAAADAGTLLATIALPSDWMNAASGGAKTKLGTWSATASAAGVAAHFRIKDSAGTTCHMQGSVGQGSGDMSLDNTNIANGQTVTVNSFTLTDANA
jgi:hypothetical protein